jgi:hypothetical protein
LLIFLYISKSLATNTSSSAGIRVPCRLFLIAVFRVPVASEHTSDIQSYFVRYKERVCEYAMVFFWMLSAWLRPTETARMCGLSWIQWNGAFAARHLDTSTCVVCVCVLYYLDEQRSGAWICVRCSDVHVRYRRASDNGALVATSPISYRTRMT